MLDSGLPEHVDDDEDLARFLFHTKDYSTQSQAVKTKTFLPSKKDRETSVFRHGAEPRAGLWRLGEQTAKGRTLRGAGIIKATNVRKVHLDVLALEPPPRHAVIINWPWLENDTDKLKAERIEKAQFLASKAVLLLRE